VVPAQSVETLDYDRRHNTKGLQARCRLFLRGFNETGGTEVLANPKLK